MSDPTPHDRLVELLDRVDRDAISTDVGSSLGVDPHEVRRRIDMYLNECFVALDLVEPHLVPGQRVLEVGAGIGAFSVLLASMGYDVLAIEPAGEGFELMHAVREALDAGWPEIDRPFLPLGVEELSPEHGRFDLAFSVHVLEHVPDVEVALRAIAGRMHDDGRSVHLCPNYAFPYDPHFGIPLVPGRPAATARLVPRRIRESGMWRSLNFVTARRVRQISERLGLRVEFRTGVLTETVDRLGSDPLFRGRHRSLARAVELFVDRLGGRRLLERWPAELASPMIFALAHQPRAAADQPLDRS